VNLAQIRLAIPEVFHTQTKLQAKDVLPNIKRIKAAKRAKNAIFVPGDHDL